jgi:hypothetical protein
MYLRFTIQRRIADDPNERNARSNGREHSLAEPGQIERSGVTSSFVMGGRRRAHQQDGAAEILHWYLCGARHVSRRTQLYLTYLLYLVEFQAHHTKKQTETRHLP